LEKENISTKLEKVNDFFNNVGYGDDKRFMELMIIGQLLMNS